jgi:DNA replication and repair protein RecF
MSIEFVEAHNFRLFNQLSLDLDHGINVIYGDNASGKTSLLESIHYLCSCKSFLAASPRKLIKKNSEEFYVRGRLRLEESRSLTISIAWQEQKVHLKHGLENIYKTSTYAAYQPILAIGPFSYKLIDDTPEIRRKYIDWGVFHVKHHYSHITRDFNRVMLQRNKLLHSGTSREAIHAWDHQFVDLAESIDQYRKNYISLLNNKLSEITRIFLPDEQLKIQYLRGWPEDETLSEYLEKSYHNDVDRKFTYYGPQRADMLMKLNGLNVRDSASRGQKKLITFALYLSQLSLQNDVGNRKGILIIDDLPSELDKYNIQLVIEYVSSMQIQSFLSCISPDLIDFGVGDFTRMFHVKRGGQIKVV